MREGLRDQSSRDDLDVEIVRAVAEKAPTRLAVLAQELATNGVDVGIASVRSCKHFALKSGKSRNKPVVFPPGYARLATQLLATPIPNTPQQWGCFLLRL